MNNNVMKNRNRNINTNESNTNMNNHIRNNDRVAW